MFSHIHIGVSDFERAFAFYANILPGLGLQLKFREPENGWAGWKLPDQDRPLFLIGQPFDGHPASAGNGQMTAFLAPSRAAVDACYRTALAAGASDEGAPGLRPQYHQHYYGAYFRDLDGNKICVCCHAP
jgi:catechol 2,3-dioxygenase-like lactoylglutathione lyase family enzyme